MINTQGLTMQQLLDGTLKNCEAIHWHNVMVLHESSLEFIISHIDFILSMAQEEDINNLPRWYAENIRVYARLTSKIMRQYKLEESTP